MYDADKIAYDACNDMLRYYKIYKSIEKTTQRKHYAKSDCVLILCGFWETRHLVDSMNKNEDKF